MADLSDVYGQNYQVEATQGRIDYIINNLAKNLAHRQFKFHLHDNNELWDGMQNLKKQYIDLLIQKISTINKKLHFIHINKNSEQINMLPELIIDTPVEYFMVIDADMGRAYFIYITPTEVNSY